MSQDSFGARGTLQVGKQSWEIYRLEALKGRFDIARLPYCFKILLENLLRTEDGVSVKASDIEALAGWKPHQGSDHEIAFSPARVVLQDFTGVPAIVDLAVMRDAMDKLGGQATRINPLCPADLVIDHSIIAEEAGHLSAFEKNAAIEFERNRERYAFLRWGQKAFENLRIVPPNTGIVHQVNLEYLAQVVFTNDKGQAYPDTLLGTDSHTTMVNGLGVLGWGVGGIEAEAAMLGQPVSMLIPPVIGVKLTGSLPEGTTATDLVLTITEKLRQQGVVGRFVEFYGPGLSALPLATRATIGNMSPEYGSTCAIFPIDAETLRYLAFTGRAPAQIALVEAYAKAQGLFHDPQSPEPHYSATLSVDLGSVVPCLAGPMRPQDRVPLTAVKTSFLQALQSYPSLSRPQVRKAPAPAGVVLGTPDVSSAASFPASDPPAVSPENSPTSIQKHPSDRPVAHAPTTEVPKAHSEVTLADGTHFALEHGHVVIAAITSCTNTSNPSVMIAAGLLAKKAVERGLQTKPWVKTSLAPGSKVVMDYYKQAGLLPSLEALGFFLVGYGCTTCIGNSGPLAPEISSAVEHDNLVVCSVLSGNRNFEGRIHPDCKMNYLASPPLVVAYALAGTVRLDLTQEPLGTDSQGKPVFLRELWPSIEEVNRVVEECIQSAMYRKTYSQVFEGDEHWNALPVPGGERFSWDPKSTYVRPVPLFEDLTPAPQLRNDIQNARVLVWLGDSVTTDHISPAGTIRAQSPAGRYLIEQGVSPQDFNSYGSRRGNHEVMIRGTFANIRLRNKLVPGTEGGFTLHLPEGQKMPIYEAAMRYKKEGVPLVIVAGKEYGSGSSRDWAAKGTSLLGVQAVLAESFERIHRSNLIGMGVLPLQFLEGQSSADLGLDGKELYSIEGMPSSPSDALPQEVTVRAGDKTFRARVRIDTPKEAEYYRHGGILPYVLRQLKSAAT